MQKFSNYKNGFLKFFCGSFGIGLFVSSDTCKGKAAYIQISPDLAKAGSHWVMLLLLLLLYFLNFFWGFVLKKNKMPSQTYREKPNIQSSPRQRR